MLVAGVGLLATLCWVMVFFVTEFRVCQRKGPAYTYGWVCKLYNKFNLSRIRW